MPNEGDIGSAHEHFDREMAIQRARAASGPRLKPKGSCHYCERQVKPEQLYCDEDCADDHAYELKRRTINGF